MCQLCRHFLIPKPSLQSNHVFVSFEFNREKPSLLFCNTENVCFFLEKNSILFFLFELKLHTPESAEQVITAYDQNFL